MIGGGSNDVGLPVAQVKKNARKMLGIARNKYPHALLALVGPMDPYGGYDDSIPIRDAPQVGGEEAATCRSSTT